MDSLRTAVCTTVLALLLCARAGAQAPDERFVPADFGPQVRSTLEGLGFELGADDAPLAIRCSARVFSNGDSNRVSCFTDPEQSLRVHGYSVRIRRALNGLTFSPARVDGEAVWTAFNFTVAVFAADGETHVRVLPHHGANVERLGTSRYVSPQRYTFARWSCNSRGPRSRATEAVAAVLVSEAGTPLDVQFGHASSSPPCLDRIATLLRRSRYIPAHVDGRPVEAIYLERFGLTGRFGR